VRSLGVLTAEVPPQVWWATREGNLYGTASSGGNCRSCDLVFKLDPTGDETVFYSFTEEEVQPALSASRLLRDPAGNLYGMARLSTGDLYRMERSSK